MRALRSHPQVACAVEASGLLIVRLDTGQVTRLDLVEAAFWELLAAGHPFDRATDLLSTVVSVDSASAVEIARRAVERWVRAGLLIGAEDTRRG